MYREIPLKNPDINLKFSNVLRGMNFELMAEKVEHRPFFTFDMENFSNEELCDIYQNGKKEALDFIITKNKKLVYSRVSKYCNLYNNSLDFDDLTQNGYIGLIKATEKYDKNKNTKFSTYSIWWIDKEILKSIFDYGFLIRIPCHRFEDIQRVWYSIKDISQITNEEIKKAALKCGIAKTKVKEVIMIINNLLNIASLNNVINAEDDTEFLNLIPDGSEKSVENIVEKKELTKALFNALSILSDREQKIIKLRYGLEDEMPKTLEEIGLILGVSKERIRQLEIKIFKQLRKPACLSVLEKFKYTD